MIPIPRKLKDAICILMLIYKIESIIDFTYLFRITSSSIGESLIDRFKGNSLIFFGNIEVFD